MHADAAYGVRVGISHRHHLIIIETSHLEILLNHAHVILVRELLPTHDCRRLLRSLILKLVLLHWAAEEIVCMLVTNSAKDNSIGLLFIHHLLICISVLVHVQHIRLLSFGAGGGSLLQGAHLLVPTVLGNSLPVVGEVHLVLAIVCRPALLSGTSEEHLLVLARRIGATSWRQDTCNGLGLHLLNLTMILQSDGGVGWRSTSTSTGACASAIRLVLVAVKRRRAHDPGRTHQRLVLLSSSLIVSAGRH